MYFNNHLSLHFHYPNISKYCLENGLCVINDTLFNSLKNEILCSFFLINLTYRSIA